MTAHGTASFANTHRTVVRLPKLLMPGSMMYLRTLYHTKQENQADFHKKHCAKAIFFANSARLYFCYKNLLNANARNKFR